MAGPAAHPPLPPLVAVHGRKRAGKGTAAAHLVAAHGYEVIRFADPMKDMLRVMLRHCRLDDATIERCLEGDLKEAPLDALGGATTRHAIQKLGTEWREMVHGPLWVDIARRRWRAVIAAGGRAVVEDLRMPDELEALEADGAALWLVTNARVDAASAADAHATERGLPAGRFHAALRNDAGVGFLHDQIEAVLAAQRLAA